MSGHIKPLVVVAHLHNAGDSFGLKVQNPDGTTGTWVAAIHPRSGPEEARAYADLFAAAPEMLEAAKKCLDENGHLRGCEGSGGSSDVCTPHCEALRHAIAKAEGKTWTEVLP